MGCFRTSSVFRFSNDYESLVKVLKTGIIPNYCGENLSYDDSEFYVGIPMVSFCDIPITLLDEHNKKYGNYGIALKKDWALKNSINPVMYVTNKEILKAIHYHYESVNKTLQWYNREHVRKELINHTIFKGFPFEDFIKMKEAENAHYLNTHIIGFLKKYNDNYIDDLINNYEENEWRYIVPDIKGTEWMWTEEDYLKWRFPHGKPAKGEKTPPKPIPSDKLKNYTLKFKPNDISYIMVKNDLFKERIIKEISKTKTIGGHPFTSNIEKDILKTQIITLEQVKKDF